MDSLTGIEIEPGRPTVEPTVRTRRRRHRRTSPAEKRVIAGVTVAASLVAACSSVSPTGLGVADVVYRAGFAAIVVLAASRARRWTWLVLAGGAAAITPLDAWLVATVAAVAMAVYGAMVRRRRVYGAVTAAFAVQVLLRAPELGTRGLSALLVAAIIAPALVSGCIHAPRRVRTTWLRGALVLVGLALVATAAFAGAAVLASSKVRAGADDARLGLASVRQGDNRSAGAVLADSAASFRDANRTLDGWWTWPARLVPLVGQHQMALAELSHQGAVIAEATSAAATSADYRSLQYDNGRIDLDRVRSLQGPLDLASAAISDGLSAVDQLRSPWLIGPLTAKMDELTSELTKAAPEASLAAVGAHELPGLLGGDGTRHYLVLFTTPAESRGLGGFVGSFAEVTATDGKLQLSRSGRIGELLQAPGADEQTLTAPDDYLARYARFRPQQYLQDITLSPDLPSVAEVAAGLYPQTGGRAVDGVMVVDPYALAGMLEFTGPISVPGIPEPLTSANAADWLLRRQYTETDSNAARIDALADASRLTFEKLVSGSIPGPARIGEVLGPLVQARRLGFVAFDPGAQDLVGRLGAIDAFPTRGTTDFFSVVTQNSANNKIDVFLHRSVEYRADFDPATGLVNARARVTLRNDAPASGLPESIIGSNGRGLPPGTNRVFFSAYSPLGLQATRIDGVATPFQTQQEFGFGVVSSFVDVPAGATVVVDIDLQGTIATGDVYRLGWVAQPLVNPDDVTVTLTPAAGWRVTRTGGVAVDLGGTTATVRVDQPGVSEVEVPLAPR